MLKGWIIGIGLGNTQRQQLVYTTVIVGNQDHYHSTSFLPRKVAENSWRKYRNGCKLGECKDVVTLTQDKTNSHQQNELKKKMP